MFIEFKRTQTSHLEVDSKEELAEKLDLSDPAIVDEIWEGENLSQDSEIFIEELFDENRIDNIRHEIEISAE